MARFEFVKNFVTVPTGMRTIQLATRFFLLVLLSITGSTRLAADTVTLAPVADTALFENNPENNLGGMTFFPAGANISSIRSRALLRFDLTSIPTNAVVTNAFLALRVVLSNTTSTNRFDLHRMNVPWIEGTKSGVPGPLTGPGAPATDGEPSWRHRAFPLLWSAPGASGDFSPTVSASTNIINLGTYAFQGPGLLDDARSWINSPSQNFGWLYKVFDETSGSTARRFGAREDPTNAPRLTLEYSIPSPTLQNYPRFTGITQNGSNVELRFSVEPTYVIALESIPAIPSTNWLTLTNIGARFSAIPVTYSDPITNPARFYRLQVTGRIR